jgi:hypothetical protein
LKGKWELFGLLEEGIGVWEKEGWGRERRRDGGCRGVSTHMGVGCWECARDRVWERGTYE